MVIIFTEKEDTTSSKVIEWLCHLNIPFLRINNDDTTKIKFKINIGRENSVVLTYGELSFGLHEIKHIWFRRGAIKNVDTNYLAALSIPIELKRIFHVHLSNEIKALHDFFYSKVSFSSINNPLDYVPNKMSIMEKAAKIGFSIPETLITTKKSDLIDFLQYHQSVISKNLQDILVCNVNGYAHSQRTIMIDGEILKSIKDNFCYSLFQEALAKKYEIRVFYFKGNFYSVANFAMENKLSHYDGRNIVSMDGVLNRHTVFCIPDEIKIKIDLLMTELNMKSGSLDFIVTEDLDFFFLEINPVGQFGYLSELGNYYIEKEIAESFN